jgi:hypothetical protein
MPGRPGEGDAADDEREPGAGGDGDGDGAHDAGRDGGDGGDGGDGEVSPNDVAASGGGNDDRQARQDDPSLARLVRAAGGESTDYAGVLAPDGTLLETSPEGLADCGPGETILGTPVWEAPWWDESATLRATVRTAIERATAGEFVRDELRVGTEVADPDATGTTTDEETTDPTTTAEPDGPGGGDEVATVDVSLSPVRDGAGDVVLVVAAGTDVTDRPSRASAPRNRVPVAERVEGYVRIAQRVGEAVVDSPSRRGTETAVCEALVAAGPYEHAVVGEFTREFTRFRPRAYAGVDEADLETVVDAEGDGLDEGAGATAVRTATVQVVRDGDAAAALPWRVRPSSEGTSTSRRDRRSREARAVASVPLGHGDTVYGVLGVYTDGPDAFDELERSFLGTLGRTAGLAIAAGECRRLLHADVVGELTLSVPAPGAPLVRAATETGATLALAQALPTDGTLLCYVDVEGATPAAVREAFVAVGTGPHAAAETGGRLELRLGADDPLASVASAGGRLVDATVSAAGVEAVVHVAPGRTGRPLVAKLRRDFPRTVLLARREVPVTDPVDDRRSDVDGLTDRQREVLMAAYHAGYYEWPRDATAQEVATALGIAPSTLHQHLRVGVRRLIEWLAATDGDRRELDR